MASIVVIGDEAATSMLVPAKSRSVGHDGRMTEGGAVGFELVVELRPEVVLLSARYQASDRLRGIEAGCDACIVKPSSPSDLLEW
ncbi:MAG TPA: hypothetical protein VMM78_15540 [Thermomicrobiales bacterium]|nr:hypothetical protein [Thermomicrobiales bacterium]